jgi:hypothetical protein
VAARKKIVKPPAKSFNEQLDEKPLDYLICRVLGHAWDPATIEVEYGVFQLGLVCTRCKTERDRFMDPQQKVKNRYWHPTGDYAFDRIGRLDLDQRKEIDITVNEMLSQQLPPRKEE